MSKYFKLGSYSISILHYSLYHWDKREVVFLRAIRAYENWLSHYYGYEADRKRLYNIWSKRIAKDPLYMFKYGKEHEKNFKKLNQFLNKNLTNITNADMAVIFTKYWYLLQLSEAIGDINDSIDQIYSRRINNQLRKSCEKQAKKSTEYLLALTTPWQMLPTQQEELEFIKLAHKVQKGKIKDTALELKKHLKKYCWIPVWYDNDPWTLNYLQTRLNKELKNKNSTNRIKQLQSTPLSTKKQATKISQSLKLKGRLLQDIKALRYFTYLRTKVDLDTGFVVHKARPIYKRIAKLLNITFKELKFLTPEEVINGLKNKITIKELKKNIKKRQKFTVQIFNRNKQKIITGSKAKQLVAKIEKSVFTNKMKSVNVENKNQLLGLCASLGKAKGPARVISSISELKTMKDGEILIVPSTSVDFISAMKKSAATVTESGGITCHAAIVSRELGKPCVVNTLVATKIFKNGDLVEVDAYNGIVKKLK